VCGGGNIVSAIWSTIVAEDRPLYVASIADVVIGDPAMKQVSGQFILTLFRLVDERPQEHVLFIGLLLRSLSLAHSDLHCHSG
jgi:hypothetical protein